MTAIDTRSLKRDSLFLSADLTLGEGGEPVRVKVRNLSDGGMMAEADLEVERGMRLGIELRNIGRIKGSVAWTQDNRFGIVFDNEIDSKRVREPAALCPPLVDRAAKRRAAQAELAPQDLTITALTSARGPASAIPRDGPYHSTQPRDAGVRVAARLVQRQRQ